MPHISPSAKRQQRAGRAGARTVVDITQHPSFALKQMRAAFAAMPRQDTLQAAAQHQAGGNAPSLRQAAPASSGTPAAVPRQQQWPPRQQQQQQQQQQAPPPPPQPQQAPPPPQQRQQAPPPPQQQQQQQQQALPPPQQQQQTSPLPSPPPQQQQQLQRQHACETEREPVHLQPASSGAHKARLQQVLASMAAAESAEEQRRPQLQRAAVRDALQLLGSKACWKVRWAGRARRQCEVVGGGGNGSYCTPQITTLCQRPGRLSSCRHCRSTCRHYVQACLKCFSALLMEEQDVKFVALHEQLQDAEDAAAEVDRWVTEQLG